MKRKYGYYWVNWGVKWVIAEWCYDDEGGEIDDDGYCTGKDFWCWSGMEIIAEPKEVDERQIVRDSFSSNSEHLLNIPDVSVNEVVVCDHSGVNVMPKTIWEQTER